MYQVCGLSSNDGCFLNVRFEGSLYVLSTSPFPDVVCKHFLPPFSLYVHLLYICFIAQIMLSHVYCEDEFSVFSCVYIGN